MKKNEFRAMVNTYATYVQKVDCYQKPTKGVNSGAVGRLTEGTVKLILNHIPRKYMVSPSGYNDTTITINGERFPLEIKNGCGCLGHVKNDGTIYGGIIASGHFDGVDVTINAAKRGYILYFPFTYECKETFNATGNVTDILGDGYLMPYETFLAILQDLNLIRFKSHPANGLTIAIQTYKTSKKKVAAMRENLAPYKIF